MKTCGKCKVSKEVDQFGLKNKTTGLRTAWCKECNREYQKGHYLRNRDTYAKKAREYERKNGGSLGKRLRAHHITLETYEEMLSRYEGLCWICRAVKPHAIDHDHSCCPGPGGCGKCVRGLLCSQCNHALGMLRDSVVTLKNAIEYLS